MGKLIDFQDSKKQKGVVVQWNGENGDEVKASLYACAKQRKKIPRKDFIRAGKEPMSHLDREALEEIGDLRCPLDKEHDCVTTPLIRMGNNCIGAGCPYARDETIMCPRLVEAGFVITKPIVCDGTQDCMCAECLRRVFK